MKIIISPSVLDGTLKADGLLAEYVGASNTFGNRVRVLGKDRKITPYLLKFNAKGTEFDLTEVSDFLPIIAFCSAYAFSDTKIKSKDVGLVKETVLAVNGMGGKAKTTEYGMTVSGNAGLFGGEVNAKDFRVVLASVLAGTKAENKTTVITENLPIDLIDTLKSLGAKIETE